MRVSFGMPLYDVRPFVTVPTGRRMPPWLLVEHRDFVRSFGGGDARAGTHTPWTGEDRFFRGWRAMRFVDPLRRQRFGSEDEPVTGFGCAFRGLFAAAPSGMFRFEVLLRRDEPPPGRRPPRLSADGLVSAVQSLGDVKVRVGARTGADFVGSAGVPLRACGRDLAQHFLHATTSRSKAPSAIEPWWVGATRMLTIVECFASEVDSFDVGLMPLEIGLETRIELYQYTSTHGQVFVIRREHGDADRDELNRLYIHLLRLHTEVETLFAVARFMLEDPPRLYTDEPSTNEQTLAAYLRSSLRVLTGAYRHGFETDAVLAEAFRVHQLVNQSEYLSLIAAVTLVAPEAATRLDQMLDRAQSQVGKAPTVIVVGSVSGGLKVDDHSVNFGDVEGDFHNSGIIGSSNFVKDSFQTIDASSASDDLKEALKGLVESVAGLKEHISDPAVGDQLGRDVTALAAEATAPSPRKSMLTGFADAITAVATTVGAVGAPVIALVSKIIGFF